MADMNQVLAKLVERTAENRVPWERSSQPGMFRASVGNLIVYITGNTGEGNSVGLLQHLVLSVMDSRGGAIGSVVHSPNSNRVNAELISLYEQAKAVAADDPRLDELIDALDAVPPAT